MGATGQSITLANSIIGVGVLAMPFCFQQCGIILATLLLLLMGLVSRLSSYFLLKSAIMARRRNFEFLAFHVFGPAGKMAVEVGIIGFLMGTCIAYFVVVGDLGPQIIAKMFNINQSDMLRTSIMVVVSVACVLPLGLLRNVDSLSNVSAATIAFYFCLVLKVVSECMGGSVRWGQVQLWRGDGVLQCISIFSMALSCQTQLFEIFECMPSVSLEKMNGVTKTAINICTGVYFTLGLFGYIAFCSQPISGNILMSLSPTMSSDVIKLGFVLSVACSFPLVIFPCRASLYSFLYRKVHSSHHDHIVNNSIPSCQFRCITVMIVAVSLCVSLLLPNVEVVLGLVGSTIGVLVCVVFPAACFLHLTVKENNERLLAKAVVIFGLAILILGTYANLQAAEQQADKYDPRHLSQEKIDRIVEEYFEAQRLKNHQDPDAAAMPIANGNKMEPRDEVAIQNGLDSEVQPPNPVPPDEPNQKDSKIPVQEKVKPEIKMEYKSKEIVEENKSNTHPKNLQKVNGDSKIPIDAVKLEKPPEDQAKEEEKKEDQLDMMKQQQLIETIKQHGEEQKELIKEQKEILSEIIKTKEELKQTKKEVNSDEAKKIAVESIQKIAAVAINSLNAVTEKPAVNNIKLEDKNALPLEKIANDAVQQIAKKAVESIVAIKETVKEEPEVPKVEIKPIDNGNQVPVQNNIVNNPVSGQKIISNDPILNAIANNVPLNINNNPPVVNKDVPKAPETIQNNANNSVPNNAAPNVQNAQENGQSAAETIPINVAEIKQNAQAPNIVVAPVPNEVIQQSQVAENVPNVINSAPAQAIPVAQKPDQPLPQVVNKPQQKVHLHSPDEPESYIQGEDAQVQKNEVNNLKPISSIDPNVPLAVAMNANSKIAISASNKEDSKSNVPQQDHIPNIPNAVNDNAVNAPAINIPVPNVQVNEQNPHQIRHKREVIDKAPSSNMLNNLDILPKVDLNDALSQRLPVEIVIRRSLKSIQEDER
ncbi:putative sodium-coupled neutral amino acid transporter 10 [Plutella xylostella]|uniref:putative sodium-coupled neutral amino acid transporter 10 n=1 Tax=Plutella xylostella TaxID=51655 RepID=UPI0020323E9A|nr:putative sodium-coupled neutral amino acid transporter 10 [Plutella xylostella]